MHDKLIALFKTIYGRRPEVVTRAPGRIEFIGNHTDYNGGTVLGASIDRGVWVGLARRDDDTRRFFSEIEQRVISLPASEIVKQSGASSWLNYPLGVLAALPAFKLQAPKGFDYLAVSDLPPGAGLSSSAAIELASAIAFLTAAQQWPEREVVVKLARYAENRFVGVPCGILDQGVSGFGKEGHLVFIDCRAPRFDVVPLPRDAHFWIFNTHTRHALVDGLYEERHRECMEAAKLLELSCLADATPKLLDAGRAQLTPQLYKRARHIIYEIARVSSAVAALEKSDLAAAGRLLTESHRSSQLLFENSSAELDFLVDALVAGPRVYGARLTGGGFGGAVMALTSTSFTESQADDVARAYEKQFGARPDILHTQTSNGAEEVV